MMLKTRIKKIVYNGRAYDIENAFYNGQQIESAFLINNETMEIKLKKVFYKGEEVSPKDITLEWAERDFDKCSAQELYSSDYKGSIEDYGKRMDENGYNEGYSECDAGEDF